MVEETAVVLTGEVGLPAGGVDEPGEAVKDGGNEVAVVTVGGPVLEVVTPAPVAPVAVVGTVVPVVGPDVPAEVGVAEGVGPDDVVAGWLAVVEPGTEVDPPAGGVVLPVLVDPPAGGVVLPVLVDPPTGGVVLPALVDPPTGGVVLPALVDPPTGGVVLPILVDPPTGGVVPPVLVDPTAGVVVAPVMVGPDAVDCEAVPDVGEAVVPDVGWVDATGVVEDVGGIKPVSGEISSPTLISNSSFPFFNDAVP